MVLFFSRFWGYLGTPAQVVIVMFAPLAALAAAEYTARRERTPYFVGLLSLLALACFMLDLAVLGRVFNVTGDAVDNRGPVKFDKRYPIHRKAPDLMDQDT